MCPGDLFVRHNETDSIVLPGEERSPEGRRDLGEVARGVG